MRTDLTESATELARVLDMVSAAGDHARELRTAVADLGIVDIPVGLDDIRQRIDAAATQLTSAHELLDSCAADVFGVTCTSETPVPGEPVEAPRAVHPPLPAPTGRDVTRYLIRMVISVAGLAFVLAYGILDAWLHLVSIGDWIGPVVGVTGLTALSLTLVDRHRIVAFYEVVLFEAGVVGYVCAVILADVAGWRELPVPSGVASIVLLLVNTAVLLVVVRRSRVRAA